MKTLGWLLQCGGRNLFVRNRSEIEWAFNDDNYTVTELVAKDAQAAALQECEDSRQLLMQLYELQEEEIRMLRERLKTFEQ